MMSPRHASPREPEGVDLRATAIYLAAVVLFGALCVLGMELLLDSWNRKAAPNHGLAGRLEYDRIARASVAAELGAKQRKSLTRGIHRKDDETARIPVTTAMTLLLDAGVRDDDVPSQPAADGTARRLEQDEVQP